MNLLSPRYMDKVSKVLAILYVFFIPLSTTFMQICAGLLLLSWLAAGNFKEKIKLTFKYPVVRTACLLFSIFLIGITYTIASWQEAFAQLEKMSKLLCFVYLIPLFNEAKLRKGAIWAFIFAMMTTLMFALLRVYGGISIPTRYPDASIFKNHIDTNLMMSLALFLLGHECITAFQKKTKALGLTLFIAMGLTVFYCLWMSGGRTGYIIFILLWGMCCLQRLSTIKMRLSGIGLLIILIGLVITVPTSPSYQPQLQVRLKNLPMEIKQHHPGNETSIGERLDYLRQSLKLIQQRPLLGWGTGSFKTAYEKGISEKTLHSTNPHNEYLNIALQWGILGLGGLLLLLGTIFKMSFTLSAPERHLAQGVLATFMVGSLANSLLMDVTSGYLFVAMISICMGAYPIQRIRWARLPTPLNTLNKNLTWEGR